LLASLLVREGGAENRAAAKAHIGAMTADEIVGYLRDTTAYDLLLAYGKEAAENLIDFPDIFADGVVLPEEAPLKRFASKGGYNQVPTIFGTNRDENKLFMFPDRRWVRMLLWVLPRVRDQRLYDATAEALSAMWKVRGADAPAAAMRGVQGPSVYVYRWDWDEEPSMLGADLSVLLGAAHGFEIPFVFGHFDLGPEANRIFTEENEPGRKELSAAMMSYWAQFAYTGDPGSGRSGELPAWTAWDSSSAEAPKFVVLDTTDGGGVRMSSEGVTPDSVVAAVEADPRLRTQRERCGVYRELVDSSRGFFTREDYVTAGKQGCANYPFEEAAAGG
jgi:para-nitrobenzyl esterase